MSASLPAQTAPPTSTNGPALGLGLLLLLGAALLLTSALLLAIVGLSALFTAQVDEALSLLMLAAGSLALGLLLTPGAYLNARKFFNLPEPGFRLPAFAPTPIAFALFMAWLASLALGQASVSNPTIALFLLPFINLAAVMLPIGIVLSVCLAGLPLPGARRAWSVFGASAILGPFLSILLELFAFIGFLMFVALYASSTPGLDVTLRALIAELQNESASLDFLTHEVAALLLAPGTTLALLGLFSLAVPIIEEASKVFLLWFYAGRLRQPVEGFVLGVLCGAAFALAENIGFASAGAENWLPNVLTRATASLPHIFNSGLMGWALVTAWQERRPARLAWAYLAVILVHGTWNALSIALALNALSPFAADLPASIASPIPAGVTWGVLIIGLMGGLFFANRQMRKLAASETGENVGYNAPLSS